MTNLDGNRGVSAALRGATLAFNGQKTDTDKPKPKPKPTLKTPNPKTTDNDAVRAASQASRDHSCASPSSPSVHRHNPLSRQTTGGSVREFGPPSYGDGRDLEHGAVSKKLSQYLGSSPHSPQYLSPGARPSPDNRSASFIAATLAASRSGSASPSPHHTGGHTPTSQPTPSPLNPSMGRNRGGMSSVNSSRLSLDLPDTSSIPPTNSLISMFEKQTEDTDPVKTPTKRRLSSPVQTKLGTTPNLRAMTPPRSLSPKTRQQIGAEARSGGPNEDQTPGDSDTPCKEPRPERVKTPPQVLRRASTVITSPESRRLGPRPNLQPPAVRPKAVEGSVNAAVNSKTSPAPSPQKHRVSVSTASNRTIDTMPPKLQPTVGTGPTPTRRASIGSNSSNDTFVSASSKASSPVLESKASTSTEEAPPGPIPKVAPLPPKPRTIRKASSMTNVKAQPTASRRPIPPTKTNNSSSSNLPLDSLTSAIMAGNLASARYVPTPTSPPPLPAPRRSGKSDNHHHKHHHLSLHKKHHTGDASTSPQRPGTLLTTLRRPHSASDDEDLRIRSKRHGKHTLRSGKGKHAHHEGARKRWRDEVSPRERKRYEAVWASNRGLFYSQSPPSTPLSDPNSDPSQLVINIVVRDIWSRSRLPFDELAEVWDLVYRGRNMGLNREEFVVGMWLIDQRLRGRKIPARVSDSVWDSTRGMRVKVPKGKKK